jgi:hypothetical protein
LKAYLLNKSGLILTYFGTKEQHEKHVKERVSSDSFMEDTIIERILYFPDDMNTVFDNKINCNHIQKQMRTIFANVAKTYEKYAALKLNQENGFIVLNANVYLMHQHDKIYDVKITDIYDKITFPDYYDIEHKKFVKYYFDWLNAIILNPLLNTNPNPNKKLSSKSLEYLGDSIIPIYETNL